MKTLYEASLLHQYTMDSNSSFDETHEIKVISDAKGVDSGRGCRQGALLSTNTNKNTYSYTNRDCNTTTNANRRVSISKKTLFASYSNMEKSLSGVPPLPLGIYRRDSRESRKHYRAPRPTLIYSYMRNLDTNKSIITMRKH